MFVVKTDHTYDWPVTVKVPVDGKHKVQKFTATFKVMPTEEATEIVKAGAGAIDVELMKQAVVGWNSDVCQETGETDGKDNPVTEPMPFNAENLAKMLMIPYVRLGFVTAYYESLLGERWREKN